jgi:septum formation protein
MIILASQSPRRQEILKEILGSTPFEVIPSSFDERAIQEKNCQKLCLREAQGKAQAVSAKHPDDIVIASDTMVLFHGQELGKPKDSADVMRMLRMLSDNVHEVVTAYCIQKGDQILKSRICTAKIFIEKMADMEIEEYIETGSPFDKAGAYGVQDTDFITSRILSGDLYTIMGLPKEELTEDLEDLGLIH